MLTILFDIYPATGHYNATLKLAKLLKAKGHRLIYIGPVEFSEKVNVLGFEFGIVDPHLLQHDIAQQGLAAFYLECFIDSFSSKRYDEVIARSKDYDTLISKYSPGLIVLDEHYIYKSIFYHKYNIKVVSVQSMTAKERDTWIPPFQSTLIPKLNFQYKIIITWLWLILIFKKRKSLFVQKILTSGQDSFSLIKKVANKYGFPFRQNIDYNLSLGTGFKNIPVIKLSPHDFDFPRKTLSNHYCVGPLVDLAREKEITDLRYLEVIGQLTRIKITERDCMIIYCSLGTVTDAEINLCDIFFKKIVDVCRLNIRYKIILSVGKYYNITRLVPKPANLYIFQQVPQIELLSHCDLMINHGGINSISECVFAGVPMLAYPLSPNWDQNGCGARVAYHRLGLSGDIRKDGVNKIAKKIDLISKRYDYYRENILKMKAKFVLRNDSKEVVGIIETLAEK